MNIESILTVVGFQCAILADFMLADYIISMVTSCGICRALVDNLCHASISGLLWLSVTHRDFVMHNPSIGSAARNLYHNPATLEVLAAAVLGSVVDADHFLNAGSLSLGAATHLAQRPFAHAALFAIGIPIIHFAIFRRQRIALLLLSSFCSHQLRDSVRRGVWCWPLGSTAALPLPVIVGAYTLLSVSCSLALWRSREHRKTYRGRDESFDRGECRETRAGCSTDNDNSGQLIV